jgi:hypothetical protein
MTRDIYVLLLWIKKKIVNTKGSMALDQIASEKCPSRKSFLKMSAACISGG